MTWWTQEGHIVAPKSVLDLLSEAADVLRDHIEQEIALDDPDLRFPTGVRVFDEMEPNTRRFSIAFVLLHLSDPDLPSPELCPWNEATLWALFPTVESLIELEVEAGAATEPEPEPEEGRYRWRRLTLAALDSFGDSDKRPGYRSRNLSLWSDRLETISGHFFWDHDFLIAHMLRGLEPVPPEVIMNSLGL